MWIRSQDGKIYNGDKVDRIEIVSHADGCAIFGIISGNEKNVELAVYESHEEAEVVMGKFMVSPVQRFDFGAKVDKATVHRESKSLTRGIV
ncbi:MAG: hypothetical protein KY445_16210 [Armatimonadetes bacterium]|nr:hypothetical protein [Armatimonadota bacterium]